MKKPLKFAIYIKFLTCRLYDHHRNERSTESGADIIKLFPGSVYGPSVISAFKAPLPQLNIMPTGGVSLENMAEWFDAV